MKNNLTKKEISQTLYAKFGISLSFSQSFFDDFIFFLSEILKNERIGRNPIDKKEHKIRARKVIVFKISNKLKKEINNE